MTGAIEGMAGRVSHRAHERHRAGDLAAARAGYEALLVELPESPGLLGLHAALALRQGRNAEAEGLLDRADAAADADPRLRLRNLNTRLVPRTAAGRDEDGRALVAATLPEWTARIVPDAREGDMLLSLADAVLRLGQPAKAVALAAIAASRSGNVRRASTLNARARLAAGEAEAALAPLQEVDRRAPSEVVELLESPGWSDIHATQCVHSCKPEGWWRKIRTVFMDDEIIITNAGFYSEWMVSSWRGHAPGIALCRQQPETTELWRRIVNDPAGELGPKLFPVRRAMRARMPPDIRQPEEPLEGMHTGFQEMLDRRAAGQRSRGFRPPAAARRLCRQLRVRP